MSLAEILVVLLVAGLVIKPNDIQMLLKKFREIKKQIYDVQNNIISYIENENEGSQRKNADEFKLVDVEAMNYYLKKIISISGKYEGDYSFHDIKQKYNQLITQEIQKEQLAKQDINSI